MKTKKVTFADIAKYTGFSKTTVSRYFNDPDSLTVENQQKIADALDALDYKENKVGRILASGKTEFIGVIIPNLYMHYYSEMLNQILATYEKYGYKFLVFAGNSKKDVERKYIEELMAYNIEGMIILSPTIPSEELASYGVPVVAIEREDKYISSVNTDNYMGGVQAASLLKKSGCDILIHMKAKLPEAPRIRLSDNDDMFAAPASGSAGYDAMAIVPCSVGSAGRIAAGISSDLIGRAADVMLKEHHRLVLVVRETPLSTIHLRNMTRLSECGAVILPACPSFYSRPADMEQICDPVASKAAAILGLPAASYQ